MSRFRGKLTYKWEVAKFTRGHIWWSCIDTIIVQSHLPYWSDKKCSCFLAGDSCRWWWPRFLATAGRTTKGWSCGPRHNAKVSECIGDNSDDIKQFVTTLWPGRTTNSHPGCRNSNATLGPISQHMCCWWRRGDSAFSLEAAIPSDPTTRLLGRGVLAIDPLLVVEVVLTLSQRMIASGHKKTVYRNATGRPNHVFNPLCTWEDANLI